MKKTIYLLATLSIALVSNTFAQDAQNKKDIEKGVADALAKKDLFGAYKEGWNKTTQFGINYSGSGFNDSWKQVNTGAVGATSLGIFFNHKDAFLRGKNIWINDIQALAGFLQTGKGAENVKKNVDKLLLNSFYGHKISEKLSAFGEANFISQFMRDKDYTLNAGRNLGSAFMSPGYLTISTGVEYRPFENLSFKVAPIANRWTFVSNQSIIADAAGYAYGVHILAGQKSISEFGSQLTVGYTKEVVKNVNLGLRYNAFKAWKDSNGNQNKPLDHRLDLVATAKINKFMNVNFTYIGILDKDVNSSWQAARGLGIGLLVNL